ncbi:unnamed protein product [Blepharisma stoltei]|uniref:Uncharacterized protein n=1 Tax=Blepharisma stoltei TaxID=1481888 RepID=A0AAU9J2D7_9CILI|nr:unnamed protein product [Blepharisma stoltei]
MVSKCSFDYQFKIVIVGDAHVGKSCLVVRQSDGTFDDRYSVTIGVEFKNSIIHIENSTVKLQLWDTAGQEKYRAIASGYYRGADAVIVMFDKTDRQTFEHVELWLEEVGKYIKSNFVAMLVGNKSDMKCVVEFAEGERKAILNKMEYIETSAKDPYQVDLCFERIARTLLKKKVAQEKAENAKIPEVGMKIARKNRMSIQKNKCCNNLL